MGSEFTLVREACIFGATLNGLRTDMLSLSDASRRFAVIVNEVNVEYGNARLQE